MSHKIANFLYDKISIYFSADEEMRDVCIYGLELILSFIFSTSIILTVGAISGHILSSIAFLAVFILVRRFTGGFHANTFLKCQLFTIAFYFVSQILSIHTSPNMYCFTLLSIVGAAIILLIGPIESPYKPLTKSSRVKNKIIGCFVFVILNITGALIYQHKVIGNMIFYTDSIIIILMLIPYFHKKFSIAENKISEENQ